MLPHHYALLGLTPDADLETIKRAWKRAATRWHPDLRGANARFDAAREAWQVLSDPGARRLYDAELQASVDAAVAAMSKLAGTQRIGGVVSRVFGVRERPPEAGRNRRLRLSVGLAEAVHGTEREVQLGADVRCDACDATGAGPEGRTVVCDGCGGIGDVLSHGLLRSSWSPCAACLGLGWVPRPPCATCAGRGVVAGTTPWIVPVPGGTRQGQLLKIAGAGEASPNGGAAGDLIVEIDIRPHAFLSVDGVDVRCDRPVPFWLASSGGRVEVPTLGGTARIAIPAGTRHGEVLRMAGFGLKHAKGKGDQLVTVHVELPATLDAVQAAALRAWGEGLAPELFSASASFDRRLREETS